MPAYAPNGGVDTVSCTPRTSVPTYATSTPDDWSTPPRDTSALSAIVLAYCAALKANGGGEAAGGEVEVWRKPSDGHHPHGLHPVDPLLRAILRATGFSQEITTKASPSVEYRSGAGWHGDSWRTQVAKMRDLAKQHAATPIVFLGDSITQGLTGARGRLTAPGGDRAIDRAFADHGAVSLGLSGDRTEHVLYRIRHGALQELNPQVIVLQIGVNNLVTGKHTANEVVAGIFKILEWLRVNKRDSSVLICGPFPADKNDSQARKTIAHIRDRCLALNSASGEDSSFQSQAARYIDKPDMPPIVVRTCYDGDHFGEKDFFKSRIET